MVDKIIAKLGACAICRLRFFRKSQTQDPRTWFKNLNSCGMTGELLEKFKPSCGWWEYDPKVPFFGENLLKLMADIKDVSIKDIIQGDNNAADKRDC